jgi:hypothetical protein
MSLLSLEVLLAPKLAIDATHSVPAGVFPALRGFWEARGKRARVR